MAAFSFIFLHALAPLLVKGVRLGKQLGFSTIFQVAGTALAVAPHCCGAVAEAAAAVRRARRFGNIEYKVKRMHIVLHD